jgi:hypothetical protein
MHVDKRYGIIYQSEQALLDIHIQYMVCSIAIKMLDANVLQNTAVQVKITH